MISNQNRSQAKGLKPTSLFTALLLAAVVSAPMTAHAQEVACKRGADAANNRNLAVIKAAERQQKAVDAVQFEIKSVSQVCNDMIKMIPHDITAQLGRIGGIAPGVTGYIQRQGTRFVGSMCRKQLNAVENTVVGARNSVLGKIADSVGMNPRDLRRLAGEVINDGAVSDETIARTISNNENVDREYRRDLKKILEEGQKDFEDYKKTQQTQQPLTASPSSFISSTNTSPSYTSPRSGTPIQNQPQAPVQQKAEPTIVERLKGLF